MARKKVTRHHAVIDSFKIALKSARSRAGTSQLDLALKAHVNIGYIGKLERGEAAPGLDLVARLAEALGVRVSNLIDAGATPASALDSAREQLRKRFERLLKHDDINAIQAVTVVIGHVENAIARKNG